MSELSGIPVKFYEFDLSETSCKTVGFLFTANFKRGNQGIVV